MPATTGYAELTGLVGRLVKDVRRLQRLGLNTLRDVDPTGLADGASPVWDATTKLFKLTAPSADGNAPVAKKDAFTVAATPATQYALSFQPLVDSIDLKWNGIGLDELDGDYSVNTATGVITLSSTVVAKLVGGGTQPDVLTAEYLTSGTLITQSKWLQYAGAKARQTSSAWAMSAMTVGARVSGAWTYQSPTPGQLLALGLADAYSVQTTVSAKPASGTIQDYDWFTGWGNALGFAGVSGSRQTGILFETDNSTTTLYLYHNTNGAGSGNVLSASWNAVAAVGDVVEVVVDFTAETATATVNGTTVASLNLALQTWYTPDGASA